MARKNPVPERDKEIGLRLLEAREDALVTRSTLAKEVAIAREVLISYEKGTVPLQFWPGIRMCKALNINETYLAKGIGPFHPYIEFDQVEAKLHVAEKSQFSRGYDEFLAQRIEHQSLVYQAMEEARHGCELSLFELYQVVAGRWFESVPRGYEGEFVKRLADAARATIEDLRKKPEKERNRMIKEITGSMSPRDWETLLENIKNGGTSS